MPIGEGLKLDDGLLVGLRELQLLQRMMEIARGRIAFGELSRVGLVVPPQPGGTLSTVWSIDDSDDNGAAMVRSIDGGIAAPAGIAAVAFDHHGVAVAFDEDGVPFTFDETRDSGAIAIPNDSVWYTVVVEAERTEYAEGTIDTAPPSTTISGNNTRLTDLLSDVTTTRSSKILVEDSASGNNGSYPVATIVDDDTCTIRAATAGSAETEIPFKLAADFDASPFVRAVLARRRAKFSVIARTRKPAAGQFVIADVRRNDAASPKIRIVDRRLDSAVRRQDLVAGAVSPKVIEVGGAIVPDNDQIDSSDFDVVGVSHTEEGGWLVVAYDSGGAAMESYTYSPASGLWGSPVTLPGVAAAGGDVVKLPPGSLYTHLVIAADGVLRGTTNNGASWTSLGTPWTAAGSDSVTPGSMCLSRWGRLFILGSYLPSGGGAGDYSVRYVYSDDYGDTWVTGAGAGVIVVDSAAVSGVISAASTQIPFRIRALDDGRLVVMYQDGGGLTDSLIFCQSDELPTPISTSGTTDHLGLVRASGPVDVLVTPGRGMYLLQGANPSNTLQLMQIGDPAQGLYAGVQELRRSTVLAKTVSDTRAKAHFNPITGEVGVAYRNTTGGITEFRRCILELAPR